MKTNFLSAGVLLAMLMPSFAQPVITMQPQSQTNRVGSTVSFAVEATGTEPLCYQWWKTGASVPGATNTLLLFTNLQASDAGNYTVVITNVEGAVTSQLATLTVLVPPSITVQPTNFLTLSLGASVTNRVTATGTTPLFYQWQFNGTNLPNQTTAILVLTNLQLTHVGDYMAFVGNAAGTTNSRVAKLSVDPTFTKITAGSIVTDHATSLGCSWGDFDNDGFPDLFIANSTYPNTPWGRNFLYHNDSGTNFTKITNGVLVTEVADHPGGIWGDFDNDGFLDLFVTAFGETQTNSLFRNLGNGTFAKVNAGTLVSQAAGCDWAAWGDYDNDGFLDLFITRGSTTQGDALASFLYRSNGDGTFTQITTGSVATDLGNARDCVWGDFDNDGQLDLFVSNAYFATNFLYRNSGKGTFTRFAAGSIATDPGDSRGCAWGDYDNDGYPDLFVANGGRTSAQSNFLYHNDSGTNFTRISNGSIVTDGGHSFGCTWGDYDNDGFLDLFVANGCGENNFLYHNNGDGTFTRIMTGSPVNDGGESIGCAWGDYDNDGFLDLVVGNGGNTCSDRDQNQRNFLYHNNANSNSWITIKLVGTVSNRSAIGAKVRVSARIGGTNRWQLRQISGGEGGGQSGLRAHFGLRDATNVATVRIEWPSGTVQELHDVAVKQFLTVTEPPRLTSPHIANGGFAFTVKGGRGFQYGVQVSTNALDWMTAGVLTVTNLSGTADFIEPVAFDAASRLYRAISP